MCQLLHLWLPGSALPWASVEPALPPAAAAQNGLGSRKLAALASLFFGVPHISGPRQLFTAWLAMHTLWMLGNASCWQLGNALALHP